MSINYLPLRINWTVQHKWQSPFFMGSAIRGMFGRKLRQSVCSKKPNTACNNCALQNSCAYGSVFEGLNKRTFKTPPQFVLQPPAPAIRTYEKNETLSCTQLLFSSSHQFLPDIFNAWQQSSLESAPYALKFASIDFLDSQSETIQKWQPEQSVPIPVLQPLPAISSTPKAIQLNLITPLYMREKGKDITPDSLRPEHLVMGAIRRSKLLLPQWYANVCSNTLPPQITHAWAQSLKIEHNLKWHQQKRWSHRQRKEIPVKGLLGKITLSGNLEPFWPALTITPIIGLGKSCNFGLGHLKLIPIN